MKYLLDTHTLIWFIGGEASLSAAVRELIENEENEVFVSIASLWEIAIKFSLGKLNLARPFDELFPAQLITNDIQLLSITPEHLSTLCTLPFHHRDPFDRLIIAQALVEKMSVLGVDAAFDFYDVKRIW
jgi:PIN domain nuclease of toxin-antitoxin system